MGTVTDPSGAAVPSAKITITNTETGLVRSTTTNTTGSYAARELAIGHYNVRVEAPGFKAYERTGITLNVNDTVRADAALQVGESKESVTVEANAIQVQADTNEVSQTITAAQVSDLATNGRNVIQLATLVPGAAASIPDFDSPMAQNQNRSISFNGQRSDHNNWLINGAEAYDRGGGGILLVSPSQDSLQEFKVMTSNYGADLGQSSGGMITMATKSGSKQFHGGAWEYVRNDAFDAHTFFANLNGQKKPELRYNTFGFNLGGPVPKIGHEKKTFFFYNQEWRRLVQGGEINATSVPAAAKTGDFSYLSSAIKVPQTNDPAEIAKLAGFGLTPGQNFPGNKIPTGLISTNATALLNAGLFPAANAANNLYYAVNNNVTNYREETARLDHQVGSKLGLMASLIYDNGIQSQAPPLWAGGTYPTAGSTMSVPSWQGVLHATYTISPTLLNEASFSLNGNNLVITDFGLYQKPTGYTVKNFFNANKDNKLPGISIGSPYNVSYTPGWWPWNNTWRSYSWKDDILWTHGSHNMKFGASYMYTHKWQQFQTERRRAIQFRRIGHRQRVCGLPDGLRLFVQRTSQCGLRAYHHEQLNPLCRGRLAGQQPLDVESGHPLGRHSPCLRFRRCGIELLSEPLRPQAGRDLPAERRFGPERPRIHHRSQYSSVEREVLHERRRDSRTERNSEGSG